MQTGSSGVVPFGFTSRFYAVLIAVADPESFRGFAKMSSFDTRFLGREWNLYCVCGMILSSKIVCVHKIEKSHLPLEDVETRKEGKGCTDRIQRGGLGSDFFNCQ